MYENGNVVATWVVKNFPCVKEAHDQIDGWPLCFVLYLTRVTYVGAAEIRLAVEPGLSVKIGTSTVYPLENVEVAMSAVDILLFPQLYL